MILLLEIKDLYATLVRTKAPRGRRRAHSTNNSEKERKVNLTNEHGGDLCGDGALLRSSTMSMAVPHTTQSNILKHDPNSEARPPSPGGIVVTVTPTARRATGGPPTGRGN